MAASKVGLLLAVAALCAAASANQLTYDQFKGKGPYSVSYDSRAILINGKRTLLQTGALARRRSPSLKRAFLRCRLHSLPALDAKHVDAADEPVQVGWLEHHP